MKRIDKVVAQIFGELQEFLQQEKNPESVAAVPMKEGKLVEFCTFQDSSLGNTAMSYNIPVIRCTEKHLNGLDVSSLETLEGMLSSGESLDLWGSLPCSPWSQYQHLCAHRYGKAYIRRLKNARSISKKLVGNYCKLARKVHEQGGRIAFEWPRNATGWQLRELQRLVRDLNMFSCDFDGCAVGCVDAKGRSDGGWLPHALASPRP